MKEKLQRFITAFKMNGEVKKKTLMALIAVVAVIAIVILVICLKPADVPDEPVVEDPVVDEGPDYSDRVEPAPLEPVTDLSVIEETFDKYPDVYAWLEIPGTKEGLQIESDTSYPVALSYPQMPGESADATRDYYLHRDLDGNYDYAGTLFSDSMVEGKYINGRYLNDPVTVIYGHNMANRSMFGGLERFIREMDFSEQHVMYMYQENGRRLTYQIVGGVQYDTSHIIYYHDFNNDEVFNEFFTSLWKETAGSTNLDGDDKPVAGDKVLILSVCKNGDTEHKHRFLIVGKLIEDTADPETWAIKEVTETPETAAE